MNSSRRWLPVSFLLFMAAMLGLALAGGIRAFHPAPYWDMWDGAIDFLLRSGEGGSGLWWEQHNEHRILLARPLFWLEYRVFGGSTLFLIAVRILLARLLFWLEYRVFGGSTLFLIGVNYLLALAGALAFCLLLRRRLSPFPAREEIRGEAVALYAFLVSWLFLWVQQENLTWAFQAPFFLVFLLPLACCYCFERSLSGARKGPYFIAALFLGALAAGAMANGILALPLLFLGALALKQRPLRLLLLLATSLVVAFAYLHELRQPGAQGGLAGGWLQEPFKAIGFTMIYLGNPFRRLVGSGDPGTVVAGLMGILLLCSWAWGLLAYFRGRLKGPAVVTLLLFIAFVAASAAATAAGRAAYSYTYATSSRYATPALLAWAALLLLLAPRILAALRGHKKKRLILAAALLSALMLAAQTRALKDQSSETAERDIAVLALELGVQDEAFEKTLYPSEKRLREIAERARQEGLSVFGRAPWKGLREELGKSFPAKSDAAACKGGVVSLQPIAGEPSFLRFVARLEAPGAGSTPRLVRLLSGDGEVLGFALAVPELLEPAAARGEEGVVGYLLAAQARRLAALVGEDPACRLELEPESLRPLLP